MWKNSKTLCILGNSICEIVEQNPLPEVTSRQTPLQIIFANHSKKYDCYCPTGECECQLSVFQPVIEDDVRKITASLPTESCERDEIPTKYLKQCLDECIGVITMIINVALKEEIFVPSRKTAVVRPLLKKVGLDLVNSNYRPVSNLNFLSKVLENLHLVQLNDLRPTGHRIGVYRSPAFISRPCPSVKSIP